MPGQFEISAFAPHQSALSAKRSLCGLHERFRYNKQFVKATKVGGLWIGLIEEANRRYSEKCQAIELYLADLSGLMSRTVRKQDRVMHVLLI